MKYLMFTILISLLTTIVAVNAHYIVTNITTYSPPDPPITHGKFVGIRKPSLRTNLSESKYTPTIYDPITDTALPAMRCNRDPYHAAEVITIHAGDNVTIHVESEFDDEKTGITYGWYHPGPLFVYMARMPDGIEGGVSEWDGAGEVWFKIYEQGPLPYIASSLDATWPSSRKTSLTLTIPPTLPAGQYLLRPEHLALHNAPYDLATKTFIPNPQFYMVCIQLQVNNSEEQGTGDPSPLVEFPGAYHMDDEGVKAAGFMTWNWILGTKINYTMPGPKVWDWRV
ncbi:glycosyl hydrolase family 61-domain-containing protein [Tricladium varicosporioides]|nr:glycosyl hydrolase family 61-domain-containing protein [Hymenoscyphus varicosporioides]